MKFMTEYLRDLTSLASKVGKVLYQGKCGQNGHNLKYGLVSLRYFGLTLYFPSQNKNSRTLNVVCLN